MTRPVLTRDHLPRFATSLLFGVIAALLTLSPVPALAVNLPFKPVGAILTRHSSSAVTASRALSDEQIDATIARIQTRDEEFRRQSLPERITPLPSGIPNGASAEEFQEWQRLAAKIIILNEGRVNNLRFLKDIRQSMKDLDTQRKGWRGFSEKPPYSLTLVDSLGDSIQARQIELHTEEMRLTIAEGELADSSSSLRESRTRQRLAEERRDQSIGKPEETRLIWLQALATRRNDLNETAVIAAETLRHPVRVMA